MRSGILTKATTTKIPNDRMDGHRQESFVVEIHSKSGYSGSPVFAYLPSVRTGWMAAQPRASGEFLLGVTWGLYQGHAQVLYAGTREPVDKRWAVPDNSGMELVVPAWKIIELLLEEEFVKGREDRERRLADEDALRRVEAVSTGAEPEALSPKDDFEQTLRNVSRRKAKPSQPDEGTSGT